jgi:hypothetical protein
MLSYVTPAVNDTLLTVQVLLFPELSVPSAAKDDVLLKRNLNPLFP